MLHHRLPGIVCEAYLAQVLRLGCPDTANAGMCHSYTYCLCAEGLECEWESNALYILKERRSFQDMSRPKARSKLLGPDRHHLVSTRDSPDERKKGEPTSRIVGGVLVYHTRNTSLYAIAQRIFQYSFCTRVDIGFAVLRESGQVVYPPRDTTTEYLWQPQEDLRTCECQS